MKWYMKYQFEYLGIQKPLRADICKPILQWAKQADYEDLMTICRQLWLLPFREYQYLAMDMMQKHKCWKFRNSIQAFEQFLSQKSWWDSVDAIAANLVGPYFQHYPDLRDEYIDKWWNGDNMWLQRTCIIFQLGYKSGTDAELLFTLCDEKSDSKEFFIQKAIGWALRQYAKTEPEMVKHFVDTHPLKPLSKREALKHLK